MIQVTAYQCDHCSKITRTKGTMTNHEKSCWKNEENKHACFDSCKHLIKERVMTDNGTALKFTCVVTKDRMYSYKTQYKKQVDKTGMLRMPLECDNYEFDKENPF